MSNYKRWFQLQSDNYMKSLKKIEELEKENKALKDHICSELTDEELEMVIGGMSEKAYDRYIIKLINEHGSFKIGNE